MQRDTRLISLISQVAKSQSHTFAIITKVTTMCRCLMHVSGAREMTATNDLHMICTTTPVPRAQLHGPDFGELTSSVSRSVADVSTAHFSPTVTSGSFAWDKEVCAVPVAGECIQYGRCSVSCACAQVAKALVCSEIIMETEDCAAVRCSRVEGIQRSHY